MAIQKMTLLFSGGRLGAGTGRCRWTRWHVRDRVDHCLAELHCFFVLALLKEADSILALVGDAVSDSVTVFGQLPPWLSLFSSFTEASVTALSGEGIHGTKS